MIDPLREVRQPGGIMRWKGASFRFKDGKLSSIYISIYNRGDAGEMDQDKFNQLISEIEAKTSEWSADKGTALKKSKLRCKGMNYLLADGAEAGQEVFHVHLHLIPRYRGDGFYMHMPPKYENETSTEDLERVAAKIETMF